MKAFWAAALLLFTSAQADVTTFAVLPSATDPEISTFDEPNYIYVNRDILVAHQQGLPEDRHQLLLWLTGTGGKGRSAKAFSALAADVGYHVIALMYPDDTPASVCDFDANMGAFEAFRLAIVQGGQTPIQNLKTVFSVPRSESIENRLIKLLAFLQQRRPREHWDQFFNEDGSIRWESIAVAGQSQGGGHAALIGIKHTVSRVLCFGAPKDFSKRYNSPAAWYREDSATPKDRFFAFNHVQDPKGCTPAQLYGNLRALGLDSFGQPADVDKEAFPFRHARILYTAYPTVSVTGPDSEGAKIAHNSAISDGNADRWKAAWTYMLTEAAP